MDGQPLRWFQLYDAGSHDEFQLSVLHDMHILYQIRIIVVHQVAPAVPPWNVLAKWRSAFKTTVSLWLDSLTGWNVLL